MKSQRHRAHSQNLHNQHDQGRKGQTPGTPVPAARLPGLIAGLAAAMIAAGAAPIREAPPHALVSFAVPPEAGAGLGNPAQPAAPHGTVFLPLLLPLAVEPIPADANQIPALSTDGWHTVVVRGHAVADPAEVRELVPHTELLAPFPNGVEMGLTGLALVLGVTLVRRHRLNLY